MFLFPRRVSLFMKRVGPKRVKLFEAGAGDTAMGALGQAIKAQKKRVGREFIASDIALRKEETLRQRGLRESPTNLKLIKECSIKELAKLPANSKDIVFDSFFIWSHSDGKPNLVRAKAVHDYLSQAMRVIKPGGRIITIQGYSTIQVIKPVANALGLKTHLVKLTNEQLANSSAEWINLRSTEKGREEILMTNIVRNNVTLSDMQEFARKEGLKSVGDASYPYALILRK